MKLKYKVLWFDDNNEFFNSLDLTHLKETVLEWGFVLEEKLVTIPEEFIGEALCPDYDLMVVDYNLEDHGEGQEFIQRIRKQDVFTEIIFYSSNAIQTLWDEVHKNQLEGIYIATRDAVQDRILRVGRQSVRKVLDLDNMRGIIMAEVGDLDLLLGDIIRAAIVDLEESVRQRLFDRFYEQSCEHHLTLKNNLDEFHEEPTVEALLSLCDSNKRWQHFMRVRKEHQELKQIFNGQEIRDYVSDILAPRNSLAHGVPVSKDDGSLSFRHGDKEEYIFNEAEGVALRKKIIRYKKAFSNIKEKLSKK
jgi:hypothetical protein